jgi:adenylate cyclase class IV
VPRNLEIKVKVASLAPYRRRIAAIPGCGRAGIVRQADHYVHVAHGYHKLRVVRGGASELIFYERPERNGARVSRYQKWTVDAPRRGRAQGSGSEAQGSGPRAQASAAVDVALKILSAALGVETVVRKTREVYLVDGARIHLDRVAGLGTFVEIEVLTERAGRRSARLMEELRHRLRLPAKSTPGSYRDLLRRRD